MSQTEQREEAVFEAALKLSGAERAAYLDQTCTGDADLRRRVEVLLGAFERAGCFMKQSAAPLPTVAFRSLPTEKPGDRIGRYKLLEQIGEGGCGIVYVAEQEEPVRRRVALKVIKLGMDTKQVIARFDAERQALAMMDHPNIAKIFDAGITDAPLITHHSSPVASAGRPYFVMELVRGIKITDYCEEHQLSPRERLDLFTQVCRAIQHAHQKGVIHRDIKPSNILITLHDGVPVPKVIDFGIAKATQGRLTDQTVYTAFEQFIGTPAYMSPEQAEMSGLDIDTRSDIYSLGVLLYELLTGKTPFDAKELLATGLDKMRRTIREVEPVKPSTRLTQERFANRVPDSVKSEIQNLKSEIDQDLDWIVMKCLEKDRTRRYETANGLATDIQRHLNNEPIVARPPSRFYRFQKSVQRNKLAYGAATAVALALVIGMAVSTAMFFKAQAEKKKAQTEAAKSQQVAQFLKDMLNGVEPWVAEGRDTTLLRDILDATSQRVETDLKGQPEVEAELLEIIGGVYFNTGPQGKAETLLRKGLTITKSLPGDNRTLKARLLLDLALVLGLQGRYPEAETAVRESVFICRELPGERNQSLNDSLSDLGWVFLRQGKLAEAEAAEKEAVRLSLKPDGSKDLRTAGPMRFLGEALVAEGKLAEAEATHRELVALYQNLGKTNAHHYADALRFLGMTLRARNSPEAEAVFREAIAVHRKFSDPQRSSQFAWALAGLAEILNQQGRLTEAEDALREALSVHSRVLGEGNPQTVGTRNFLIAVLQQEGKTNEAKALLESQTNAPTQKKNESR